MVEANVEQAIAEYRKRKERERERKNRIYRETHREQMREYQRKWREANQDKCRAYRRAYYWRQKELAIAELEAVIKAGGARMRERMTLANLLKRKMADYGFDTLKGFAEFIGLGEMHLYKLMTGIHYSPRMETRRRICKALDIAPDVLEMAVKYSINGV